MELKSGYRDFRKLIERPREKIRKIKLERRVSKIRKELRVGDFTILSQNCIGGVFYHDIGGGVFLADD